MHMGENKKKRELMVTGEDGEVKTYPINYGAKLKVVEGQHIEAGDELIDGSINPHDLLRILGSKRCRSTWSRKCSRYTARRALTSWISTSRS